MSSKQTRLLSRRLFGMILLPLFAAILLSSAVATVQAADPPNQPFDLVYTATDVKYRIHQEAEGMLGQTEGAVVDVAIDGTAIVKAYLVWAGLGRDNDGVLISRDGGTPVRVTAPPELTWNNDTYGTATWGCCGFELSVYAADITDTDVIALGTHDYTISDMDIMHMDNGQAVSENWGYSLLIVYEDPTLAQPRDVFIKLGNDGLFANWTGLIGPNSDVQCIAYGAESMDRRASFSAVVGGVETDRRPNALWGLSGDDGYVDATDESGTWTADAGLIHLPPNIIGAEIITPTGSQFGGTELDGPFPDDSIFEGYDDNGSPFSDRAGDEWDEYTRFDVEIAAGDEWTCLQVESASQANRPDLPAPDGNGNDWVPASIGFLGFMGVIEPLEVDEPAIDIVKYTNDQDANDPDGAGVPIIAPGATVTWTYEVTNIGTVDIPEADITVTDSVEGAVTQIIDKGDGDDVLAVDEVWFYQVVGTAINVTDPPANPDLELVADVCTQDGAVTNPSTAYTNVGTVTIPTMSAEDPSSYCNPEEEPEPQIAIVKFTNGQDANDPNGAGVPVVAPSETVTWTYEVTNIGEVDIPEADITVTDNVEGEITQIIDKGDGDNVLAAGEVWLYQAVGTALNLTDPPSDPGLVLVPNVCTQGGTGNQPGTAYTNVGTVTIPAMTDEDPSSYCNPQEEPDPLIDIVKFTNGQDANDPNGSDVPVIAPDGTVIWTYEVTNVGTVDIPEADITVTDNVEGTVTQIIDKGDGDAVLAVDEVWIYQATGTAIDLASPPADPGLVLVPNVCTLGGIIAPATTAYTNVGTVTIPTMSAEDPSSYCNTPPTAIDEPGVPNGPTAGTQIYMPLFRHQ